jgi:twinkle protein
VGKIVVKDQPCMSPSCESSDARQVYEDGTSFCFSCKDFFPKQDGEYERAVEREEEKKNERYSRLMNIEEIHELPHRALKSRGISQEVTEFFGVRMSASPTDGKVDRHYYPYNKDQSYKIRVVEGKKFIWVNKVSDLFGQDRFNNGGKRVIIVEGEIDVLSVGQASFEKYNGRIYPVVGLSSAAMANESLLRYRDWLRSFDEIVLWLDNDAAGEEALKIAIKILGHDKVKIVKTPYKDANECLDKTDANRLMSYIFDAAPYVPSGIISTEGIWKKVVERQNKLSIPYPDCARGLNLKTKGFRAGEADLFISGTGSGKSTLMKELALHLSNFQPDLEKLIAQVNERITVENAELPEEEQQKLLEPYTIKVGIVSLEEPPAETGSKLAAMYLKRNSSEEYIPLKDLKVGFDAVFKNDNIMLLDHQGSMNDSSIIEKLEYMILSGCTHLIIDHITILVSEGADGLMGNEAIDKVMNDLLRLLMRYPHVWIGLVSHLRKTNSGKPFEAGNMPTIDDIKGSGSIKQVAFGVIAFCRDMTSPDEDEQNTINMSVLKCRFSGLTGPVPGSRYDRKTGRLQAIEDANDGFKVLATETVKSNDTPKQPQIKAVPVSLSPKPAPNLTPKPSAAGIKIGGF